MANTYRDLIAWQKAIVLVVDIYKATERFPKHEIYGLTAQVRRAAVSVPSNIAEGQGRLTKLHFKHFLGLSRGSLLEIETQLIIARELGYLTSNDCAPLLLQTAEVGKILNGLMATLKG